MGCLRRSRPTGSAIVTAGGNYGRQKQVLELEHYLDVLSRKPGALAGSRPLEQQRRAGLWPDSFDQIWHSLMMRHGKQTGTREMVELLKLTRQFGQERLRVAIETALETGCTDAAAVQHLLQAQDLEPAGLRGNRHRRIGTIWAADAGHE